MSSKLVRKGLELLHKDAGLRSQKRKAAEKAKQPSKKRKGAGTVKDKQRARGVQNQGLKLSTGIKICNKARYFHRNSEEPLSTSDANFNKFYIAIT